LFFVIYPKPHEHPVITITVSRDGEEIMKATPDVGTLDEVNTYPMIQRFHLPVGQYLATVSVEQAGLVSTETLPLQIKP
jgi:hypothetical protein